MRQKIEIRFRGVPRSSASWWVQRLEYLAGGTSAEPVQPAAKRNGILSYKVDFEGEEQRLQQYCRDLYGELGKEKVWVYAEDQLLDPAPVDHLEVARRLVHEYVTDETARTRIQTIYGPRVTTFIDELRLPEGEGGAVGLPAEQLENLLSLIRQDPRRKTGIAATKTTTPRCR